MKADKSILAKLTKGLKGRKAYEAEVLERMNRTHPGASWHYVSRTDAFGCFCRVLVSVPND